MYQEISPLFIDASSLNGANTPFGIHFQHIPYLISYSNVPHAPQRAQPPPVMYPVALLRAQLWGVVITTESTKRREEGRQLLALLHKMQSVPQAVAKRAEKTIWEGRLEWIERNTGGNTKRKRDIQRKIQCVRDKQDTLSFEKMLCYVNELMI